MPRRRIDRLLDDDSFISLIDLLADAMALVRRQRSGFMPISTASPYQHYLAELNERTTEKELHELPTTSINPFYAARLKRVVPVRQTEPDRAGLCPAAAGTAERIPVPHLTSLYHFHRAGEYGDRKWPGNCGGNLIKDLLNYFRPRGWSSTQ